MIAATFVEVLTPWIALTIGGSAYLIASRFGGRPAALEYAESEVKRLERQCTEQALELTRRDAYIKQLEIRTDVAKAVEPVTAAIRTHEIAAGKRADAMLTIMEAISAKLGPDEVNGL